MSFQIAPILGARHVLNAVTYYGEKLGFACPDGVFMGGGEEPGGVYGIVHRDGISFHLQIRRHPLFVQRERIESEAYVYIPDADLLHAEFVKRGAIIFRGLLDNPDYGLRDFIVEDPEGNRILFGSPLA